MQRSTVGQPGHVSQQSVESLTRQLHNIVGVFQTPCMVQHRVLVQHPQAWFGIFSQFIIHRHGLASLKKYWFSIPWHCLASGESLYDRNRALIYMCELLQIHCSFLYFRVCHVRCSFYGKLLLLLHWLMVSSKKIWAQRI